MNQRQVAHQLGFAIAGVTLTAIAVWWWRRPSSDNAVARAPVDASHEANPHEVPRAPRLPEQAPRTERELSARPRVRVQRSISGDDYEAIGVDGLAAAFLTRATDGMSGANDDDDDPGTLADKSGFRIITPRGSE